MPSETISFHLSSDVATQHGGSSRYILPLAPDLQIPATAEATVYLHNLLFNNQLANVDGDLYANNQLNLTFGGTSVPSTLSPGAYSIADIERYIAQQLYANPTAWTAYNAEVVLLEAPGALKPQGLANPYNGTWDLALSYEQIQNFSTVAPVGYVSDKFYMKPFTLVADVALNRVAAITATDYPNVTVGSTLWEKLFGFSSAQSAVAQQYNNGVVAVNCARVDKSRAIAFHCPSLATGTYSTGGKLGGSQLALVPITSKLGETQNWEANIPIRVPSRAVGSSVGSLDFYLANEDGLPVNLMGDRFEAVVVLEYSY